MRRIVPVALLLLLVSCSSSVGLRRTSNLVDYLYPGATAAPDPPATAVRLQLPLRVGIAFVPVSPRGRQESYAILPANAETRLLSIVRKSFEGREWVREVVVIPSTYLTPGGGFENLGQVARLMNVDVIALASVDQIQHSDPTPLSFLYISVVGAYTLPLDRNDTRTLIDAAVFHVPSRMFLLRAPGQSHVKGHSTAVGVHVDLRENSLKGFELAMEDLARNLSTEVEMFKQRVAEGSVADVDIVSRSGQSVRQSGSIAPVEMLLACAALLAVAVRRRWVRPSS